MSDAGYVVLLASFRIKYTYIGNVSCISLNIQDQKPSCIIFLNKAVIRECSK